MSEARSVTPYAPPEIRDFGRLSVLTAFDGGGLHFAQISLGSLPGGGSAGGGAPVGGTTPGPGTSTQGVLENTQSGGGTPAPDVPHSGAVKEEPASSPDTSSGGSAGARAGLGGGSESLPFTGMDVGPVAALGAGLAAAGATLRRFARRG